MQQNQYNQIAGISINNQNFNQQLQSSQSPPKRMKNMGANNILQRQQLHQQQQVFQYTNAITNGGGLSNQSSHQFSLISQELHMPNQNQYIKASQNRLSTKTTLELGNGNLNIGPIQSASIFQQQMQMQQQQLQQQQLLQMSLQNLQQLPQNQQNMSQQQFLLMQQYQQQQLLLQQQNGTVKPNQYQFIQPQHVSGVGNINQNNSQVQQQVQSTQYNSNNLNNLNKQTQNLLMLSQNQITLASQNPINQQQQLAVNQANQMQQNYKTPQNKKVKKIQIQGQTAQLTPQAAFLMQVNSLSNQQNQQQFVGNQNDQSQNQVQDECLDQEMLMNLQIQQQFQMQQQLMQSELMQQQIIGVNNDALQISSNYVEDEDQVNMKMAQEQLDDKNSKTLPKPKQKPLIRKSQNVLGPQNKQAQKEQIIIISSNLLPLQPQIPQNEIKKTNSKKNDGQSQQQVLDPKQQQEQNQLAGIKQGVIQTIQDIVKPVISRSEDMNYLKQIIDIKNRKLKPKYTDSQVFFNILQKESQRESVEAYHLNKTANIRIEDKPLIKKLQKSVKKMLKPFKGMNFDDFVHAELHLNEIMVSQQDSSQANEQMKESRKRHMRILQAALKECIVDPQVCIAICIQVSRQAFFNELKDYFQCAYENINGNQQQVQSSTNQNNNGAAGNEGRQGNNTQSEILNYCNLKKQIQKAKLQAKVQIQHNKKLDKMLKVLLDQNTETQKQISIYKEKYEQKKVLDLEQEQHLSNYTRNRDTALNTGRNLSVIDFIKDQNQITQSIQFSKKQTISVDNQMDSHRFQNGSHIQISRSGNQTMQNFYNTPQMKMSSKVDQQLISVRLGNQKAVQSNSKILAPISKLNLSSKAGSNPSTVDSMLYDSMVQQQQVYLENLDLKNLKRLNQLPSIQHQHLNSGVSTPMGHQAQLSAKDSSNRGSSAENLLKLLYKNKNKKLLDPINPVVSQENTEKIQTILFQSSKAKQHSINKIIKINSSPPKIQQKRASMSRIEIQNERSRAAKDQQGKSNKYIMNHVSFSIKENDSNMLEINKSLSSINLKQTLSSTSQNTRMIKTSNPNSRPKFKRASHILTSKGRVDCDQDDQVSLQQLGYQKNKIHSVKNSQAQNKQLSNFPEAHDYKISEQFDAYLTRFFNKKEIVSFMISHQAKLIQIFWRQIYIEKVKAKLKILKHWRLHKNKLQSQQSINSKIYFLNHKRAAKVIEKAYQKYLIRKKFGHWKQFVDYSKIRNFMQKVYLIQRGIRKFLNKKYKYYHKIELKEQRLGHNFGLMKNKYITQSIYDSQRLQKTINFSLQQQSLDDYMNIQCDSLIKEVQAYGKQLEKAVEENLDKRDWNFNSASREWTNQKLCLTLKNNYSNNAQNSSSTYSQNSQNTSQQLQTQQSSLITTPLQKLIEVNKQNFVPSQSSINKQIEYLCTARDKMQYLLNQEKVQEEWQLQKNLKNHRIQILDHAQMLSLSYNTQNNNNE
eukprot:403331451